jgi:hypothetical protein
MPRHGLGMGRGGGRTRRVATRNDEIRGNQYLAPHRRRENRVAIALNALSTQIHRAKSSVVSDQLASRVLPRCFHVRTFAAHADNQGATHWEKWSG